MGYCFFLRYQDLCRPQFHGTFHSISILCPWYFHSTSMVVFPWYVPCGNIPVVEAARIWKNLEHLSTNHEPIGFLSFSWNRKIMDFFKWRSPKPIKSEQSMDILHYFAWFYIILPLPTRFAPRGHLIQQCHLTVNFVALQNCHLLPLFCVDATNIQKKGPSKMSFLT